MFEKGPLAETIIGRNRSQRTDAGAHNGSAGNGRWTGSEDAVGGRARNALADVLPFFRAWTEDPRRVASITPSSRALADLITREISAETGSVLELGPGTGVFTRALLERGVRECDLTLVENGLAFAELLRERFPDARIVRMDAAGLARTDLFGDYPAGAVVSGLPLLSMSPRQVMAILTGAFAQLRDGGAFYQFTYTPRCPIPRRVLDRLGLRASRVGLALFNIPPAVVFRISRNSQATLAA